MSHYRDKSRSPYLKGTSTQRPAALGAVEQFPIFQQEGPPLAVTRQTQYNTGPPASSSSTPCQFFEFYEHEHEFFELEQCHYSHRSHERRHRLLECGSESREDREDDILGRRSVGGDEFHT